MWQDFRITPHINYAYIHCLKKMEDIAAHGSATFKLHLECIYQK